MKKLSILLLLLVLAMPWTAKAQTQTVTVCDGTSTNGNIPVYGSYIKTVGAISEFIIPATAEGMNDLAGGTITKLAFYISNPPGTSWGSPSVEFYMGEAEGTKLSGIVETSDLTLVTTVALSNQNATMEVTLTDPYTYQGGNLLIATRVKTAGSTNVATRFYGISAESGTSRYRTGTSGVGSAQSFIPKTTFTYTPAEYPAPANLQAGTVTAHAATLSWATPQTSHTISGYSYQYKKHYASTWGPEVPTTANEVTIDVNCSTDYEFRVKALYDNDENESAYVITTFTSANGTMTPGYTCGFEGPNTGSLPNGWSRPSGTSTSNPSVSSSGYHEGLKCLSFYGKTTTTKQIGVMPASEGSLTGKYLSFYAKISNASYVADNPNVLSVGYMTNSNDANSFVAVESFSITASYTEEPYIAYFDEEYSGDPRIIAIRSNQNYSTDFIIYVDDVTFGEIPTCFKPQNLTATLTLGNGTIATLNWEPQGNEEAWVLEYGTASDFSNATSVPVTGGTPSQDLTGLTAEQTYYARVKPDCDTEGNLWSDAISFTPTAICSLTVNDGTTTNSNVPFYYYNVQSNNLKLGSQFIIPAANLASIQWASLDKLTFYCSIASASFGAATFAIYAGETDVTTQTTYTDWETLTNVYDGTVSVSNNMMTIEFTTPYTYRGGNLLIGFKQTTVGTRPSYYNWYGVSASSGASVYNNNNDTPNQVSFLPKVTIEYTPGVAPSCLPPTNLAVTNNLRSATITWNSEATEFSIAHSTDNTANPDDCIVGTAYTNSYTMNNLSVNNHYFWVRANCSANDQSSWTGPVGVYIGYCVPAPTSTNQNGISNVTFGVGNNIVNNDTPKAGYADYSSLIGAVEPGVESDVVITYATTATLGTCIWVDLNDDLDFDDVGEIVYYGMSAGSTNPHTLTAQITIPATQASGDYRMRIGGADSAFDTEAGANPCYSGTWAVFQDYTLRVLPASTKVITSYGDSENGGYYLIASPVTSEVSPSDVGMITDNYTGSDVLENGTYDLYNFDEAQNRAEWRNYRVNAFNLVNGKGYLYASKNGVTLNFPGTLNSGNSKTITLSKTEGTDFEGWNLVGNPFTKTAYITDSRRFYVMNSTRDEVIVAEENSIAPREGVFVIANSDREELTFSTTAPNKHNPNLALNLSYSESVIDRAIVSFEKGEQLPKFQINKNSTKIYIPVESKDYAIVSTEGSVGEIPVSFKAENNGSYTLSITSENVSFAYLHLIDNLTGADVDLLAPEPVEGPASYTFNARTTDYKSRFKLVFCSKATEPVEEPTQAFAYYSNGNWVIANEGHATLQVVDINGRILKSENINGCANVNFNAVPGVYMIRLVNADNVKVQKVVVK